MKVFTKQFYIIIAVVIAVEALSFVGHFWPLINTASFILICLAAIYLNWKNLKYGLFLIFAELFIGSFGYLFSLSIGDFNLSIRIALWLITMLMWLWKVIMPAQVGAKTTKTLGYRKILSYITTRDGNDTIKYFYALFAFVGWGLIMGLIRGHNLNQLFFDFNNWLYLTLLFPILMSFKTKQDFLELKQIFLAAMIWLSAKTCALAYIFTHNFGDTFFIYQWIRDTRVGEITPTLSGFFRIFFQSHIYILLAYILLSPTIIKAIASKQKTQIFFWLSAVFLAVIIMSMSRSFWVALIISFLLLLIYSWRAKTADWLSWLKISGWLILNLIGAFAIITVAVKFPWPTPINSSSAWNILNERSNLNEAAVSSRWSQLPVLWEAIKQAPLLGQGFGTTIIYQSSDPRILQAHPDGRYETYAFEWAWLDLWLKLGLFGALTYLLLLIKLMRNALKLKQIGLALCVIALITVNIFTPYLNHPLGLGAVIIIAIWLSTGHK